MKNKFLYSCFASSLLLTSFAFAETVTTNISSVPLQVTENNPQVILLLPASTTLTKNFEVSKWYNVTYENTTGYINKEYTAEYIEEKNTKTTSTSTSNSTSASYSGDIENLSDSEKMIRIEIAANKYGKQYNLDPYLILALIKVESGFNPNATSDANCRGLMQISYKYASGWGIDKTRLYEIEYNIQHGTRILKNVFIAGMDGNVYDGLRAYNQGVSGAKKSSSNGQRYADKIMKYYEKYKGAVKN